MCGNAVETKIYVNFVVLFLFNHSIMEKIFPLHGLLAFNNVYGYHWGRY